MGRHSYHTKGDMLLDRRLEKLRLGEGRGKKEDIILSIQKTKNKRGVKGREIRRPGDTGTMKNDLNCC